MGGGRKFGSIQGSSCIRDEARGCEGWDWKSQVAYNKLGGKFTSSRYQEHFAPLYHDCNSCTGTSIFVYATLIFSLFMQASYQGTNVPKFLLRNGLPIYENGWIFLAWRNGFNANACCFHDNSFYRMAFNVNYYYYFLIELIPFCM